jgi:hypothetical protein
MLFRTSSEEKSMSPFVGDFALLFKQDGFSFVINVQRETLFAATQPPGKMFGAFNE